MAKNQVHIQQNTSENTSILGLFRLMIVYITDAALELGIQPPMDPDGIQQQLQNFYQQLDQRLARMEAKMANTQIASHNRRSQSLGGVEAPLCPPQKYVSISLLMTFISNKLAD